MHLPPDLAPAEDLAPADVYLAPAASADNPADSQEADSQEDLYSADSQEDLAAPDNRLTARLDEERRRERAADSLEANTLLRTEQVRRHERWLAAQRRANSDEWLNNRDLVHLHIWTLPTTPPLQEPQPGEPLQRKAPATAVSLPGTAVSLRPRRRRRRPQQRLSACEDLYEPPQLTSDERVMIEEAKWWRREQEEIRREQAAAEDEEDEDEVHLTRLIDIDRFVG